MTTPILPSITDELLDSIEKSTANDLADPLLNGEGRTLAFTVAALIARLRAAEKDAALYRFVRSEDTKPGFLSSCPERAIYIDEYLVCESVMDARIDTAMEQQP